MGIVHWLLSVLVGMALVLGSFGPNEARAELAGGLPALEGRLIAEVRVKDSTQTPLGELERLIKLPEGEPLSGDSVRTTVERLYGLRKFRRVTAWAWPIGTDQVGVLLVLEPKRVLREVRISGAEGVGEGQVLEIIDLSSGDELENRDLQALEARVARSLARQGWRMARVTLGLSAPDALGAVDLFVDINSGERTRLGQIRLRGWVPFPLWELDVGIKPGDLLDLGVIESALTRLEANLRRRGYWDARVAPPTVIPQTESATIADVLVDVRAGAKVEVRIDGNHRVSARRLREDVRVLSELGSDSEAILEARDRMLARYERLGYYRAHIDVSGRTSSDGRRREVLYRIKEGPGSRVVSLQFPGAKSFNVKQLRGQVRETVARFLEANQLDSGVDPTVVDRGVRGSLPDTRRKQPSTSFTNLERVYIPRAYRAAVDTIADVYRSAGFQMVKVQGPKLQYRTPELLDVFFHIDEGPRWILGSVAFTGHTDVLAQDVLDISGLRLSDEELTPLVFEEVESGRRAILQWYQDMGYAFASVSEELRSLSEKVPIGGAFDAIRRPLSGICGSAKELSQLTCPVEVRYHIRPGPRVRVGQIRIQGLRTTRRSVVEGEYRFRTGDYLSTTKLAETRNNLIRLGVFERVVVRTEEEDQPSDVKDVVVELVPRNNIIFEIGGGASTEEGFRLFSSFTDRNLLGQALRFQANAKVNLWLEPLLSVYDTQLQNQIEPFYRPESILKGEGQPIVLLEYELAVGVSYPRILLLPDGFSLGLDFIVLRDYDPAFAEENQRATFIASYEGLRPRLWGQRRPMTYQLRLSFERSHLECNASLNDRQDLCSTGEEIDLTTPIRLAGENRYLSIRPRISWDFRDNPVQPRSGAYVELEGELAQGWDDQSPSYARVEGRVNFYTAMSSRTTLVTSIRGGRIFPTTEDTEIPVNRRFFAGGRSTIRGYPEKTLLPQDALLDEQGVPTTNISSGGLLYLALKAELRVVLFEPLSLAGFYDVGDLWRLEGQSGCGNGQFSLVTVCQVGDADNPRQVTRALAQGVGVGIRLATPVGPLAIDLGVPLRSRRDPGVSNWTLHFSVGPF
ncbi:MAG: BamA/TamA family outer membrane protein [Myxococcales bacterium]|nr:BamA/TamA family outer membrane protein [Myxococcales bacterium]